MEPRLAVWSGMYLDPSNIYTSLSEADLASYVELAMNELEFILGPVTSTYGSVPASLGYPDPWNLNYVEIGNEDNHGGGETSYVTYRFYAFFSAINAMYPWITVISSTGDLEATGPGSATDYHIYNRPDDFVSLFGYWDNAPRTNKVLVGEYGNIQGNVFGEIVGPNWVAPKIAWPMWVGAVSEAVWSLGVERNGDNMTGMSYTPSFQNSKNYEWSVGQPLSLPWHVLTTQQPDLISFSADPAQNVLSTSYYAIQLLSSARYNSTVSVKSDSDFGPAYYVAGVSAPGNYTFKAAIYNAIEPIPFSIYFEGILTGHVVTLMVLNVDDSLGSNVLLANGTVTQVVNKKVETLIAGNGGVLS
jgi:alpha-N-arabinofuranosidase